MFGVTVTETLLPQPGSQHYHRTALSVSFPQLQSCKHWTSVLYLRIFSLFCKKEGFGNITSELIFFSVTKFLLLDLESSNQIDRLHHSYFIVSHVSQSIL